jgi:hypothetical protein
MSTDTILYFLSGLPLEVFIISDGSVAPYLLDPNVEESIPVIPPEVETVNLTWEAGPDMVRWLPTSDVKGILTCKTNTLPILMHQMRISTTQVSTVMLRSKKLEIRKKN